MKKKLFTSILRKEPVKIIIELAPQYAKLFEPLSEMHPDGITCFLFENACKIWNNRPWHEFGAFLNQIEAYSTTCQLSPERDGAIAAFLSKQKAVYLRGLYIVESRPCLNEWHKDDLIDCYEELKEGRSRSEFGRPEISGPVRTSPNIASILNEPVIVPREYHDARLKEVSRRLRILATHRAAGLAVLEVPTLTIPLPAIGTADLPPERESKAFFLRLVELQDIIAMSYSTPDDDGSIKLYNYSRWNQAEPRDAILWCPMNETSGTSMVWLRIPLQQREAIRLGFMHGLCKMIQVNLAEQLIDWRRMRLEVTQLINERILQPISKETERTGDYAKGKALVEEHLSIIYGEGQHLPYHQDFENTFINAIKLQPLNELDGFLDAFSERKNLTTALGYTYLLDIVTNTTDDVRFERPALIARATSWLSRATLPASAPKGVVSQDFSGPFTQATTQDDERQVANQRLEALPENYRTPLSSRSSLEALVSHQLPVKRRGITIEQLCLLPFTPADLTDLLQHLRVLDSDGNNLTVTFKGRNRSQWGKFTAAYRVLQRYKLMDVTSNDVEWADAFKIAYKVELGPEVRGHSLAPQGFARRETSDAFKEGVENARYWVERWLEQQKSA